MLAPLKHKADYTLSLAPFGIRVFSANTDSYKVLKDTLMKAQVKFYTYQLREEQMTKIVLHGLPQIPINDLKTELINQDIKPTEIKMLNIHQKKYDDHAVYLLYFPKIDKVKISTLREIRYINHVKVRWQYYTNKRQGPMQCSRCMMYGHGGRNCGLNPVCIRCGGDHFSNACTHLKDPLTGQARERIPDDMVKCGLCGQNHPANYSRCVKRLEFIDRQKHYRMRTQRQRPAAQTFTHAPQLNDFNYPPINQNYLNNQNNMINQNTTMNQPQQPFTPYQRARWAENIEMNRNSNLENNLYTAEELIPILSELMNKLRGARTRMEQIQVLTEIAFKYGCQ